MEISDSRDHRHAVFGHEGKVIVRTRRSLGSGDIEGKIRDFIRQQMHLNDSQFRSLIACPLKRDGYTEILGAKGLL
jgi:hypothetical protein